MTITEVMYLKSNSIPESWVEERLGDLVLYEKGKKPKILSKQQNNEYKYAYINIKGFEQGLFDEYSDGKSGVICSEDDFLLVWDGARSGLVGKGMKGLVGSTLVKINFPGIYNEYAYYYLKSKYYEINTNAKGTGIPHVNPDLLWNYRFPIPPIQEQHRIVEKIEELFSELDKGIEYLQTAKEQLEVYRQAVLKAAFEGKLTKEWSEKKTDLPSADTRKWEKHKLGKIAKVSGGITKNSKKNVNKKQYPYLRVANVYANRLDLKDIHYIGASEDEYNKTLLNRGDLLFVEGNGSKTQIGRVAVWNGEVRGCLHQNHIIKVRPTEKMLSKYCMYYFISRDGRNQIEDVAATTSGLYTLSITKIKNLELPIPSLDEQHQIVQEIESRLSVCDYMEETVEKGLAQAEALKQSILKKAFEGRLVPQDPDDEPAAVLLERIRAEKRKQDEATTAATKKTKKGKKKHE